MKIEILKKGDKKMEFSVKGIDFKMANAVRRAAISYVPSMAVEKATVYENTSPLYEEMIVNRIGLVPLSADPKTYNLKSECKCEGKGCARCQVSLILEKSGPGVIYSGDLKSRDPKVKPVYDKIPLVKLAEGQNIKMEFVAGLGFFRQHSKYQAGIASYKQLNDTDFEFFVESYNNFSAREMMQIGLENMTNAASAMKDAFSENLTKKESKKEAKEPKKAEKEAKPVKEKAEKASSKKK